MVVDLRANLPSHSIAVERDAGSFSFSLGPESLCAILIVSEEVMGVSNVDVFGKRQCHERPLHNDRVGSNSHSKEKGGQQR